MPLCLNELTLDSRHRDQKRLKRDLLLKTLETLFETQRKQSTESNICSLYLAKNTTLD